jgi:hypothetical protein
LILWTRRRPRCCNRLAVVAWHFQYPVVDAADPSAAVMAGIVKLDRHQRRSLQSRVFQPPLCGRIAKRDGAHQQS